MTCVVERGAFSPLVVYRYNSYKILLLFISKFVIIVNLSFIINKIVYQFNHLMVNKTIISERISLWRLLIDIGE